LGRPWTIFGSNSGLNNRSIAAYLEAHGVH
jgi:hypothetical protein